MLSRLLSVVLFVSVVAGRGRAADRPAADSTSSGEWSAKAAAKYLDSRAAWWETWPPAQRDHQTVCVSCHTMLPYALSRPKLSAALKEQEMPAPESIMIGNLRKRVSLWSEVQPYYLDATSGKGKSRESRSTESVLNALVLASNSANQKHLDAITRTAFDSAWALQLKSGEHSGAWDWQVFHLSPWEGIESQYQGATFMALAVGWAAGGYAHERAIQENLKLLRSYLKREYASQPLLNQIVLLWASGNMPGLLSSKQKRELTDKVLELKQPDGGWSLASFGKWVRSDGTPQRKESDGYATGLVTLALARARTSRQQDAVASGRSWLEHHQNKEEGSWSAASLNKQRDPKTDVGRFMTDAATGYAVLALETAK